MQQTVLQQSTYRWVCFPTMEEAAQAIYWENINIEIASEYVCVHACVSTTQNHTVKNRAFLYKDSHFALIS